MSDSKDRDRPDSIEVTPAMIDAGVSVLEAFEGEVTKPTLAEMVYQAMERSRLLSVSERK
ncbi:hypothetical protein [Microvirga roseola]|uniref:hypothetical protein n=1 Tax=Microvirga roseola TaxID=2883126 RepID=UPI001E409F6B|nr:hypothetical protein [Microvirga roseola]